MAVVGLHFCARAFSSCGKRGPLFIAVCGPLTVAASLVAEHRLQTRRLSSCGAWAQLLRGMWDLPRPGLEPVSPALAGRFPTTAPPGKPSIHFFCCCSPDFITSVVLSSNLLILSSACLNLFLNPYSVFFILVIVFKLQTFFLVPFYNFYLFIGILILFIHHFPVFVHVFL